jgi:hypothetical protein
MTPDQGHGNQCRFPPVPTPAGEPFFCPLFRAEARPFARLPAGTRPATHTHRQDACPIAKVSDSPQVFRTDHLPPTPLSTYRIISG